jgi:hypothetical protein
MKLLPPYLETKMFTSFPTRAQIAPHVLFQELDGEAVLLDLATERYYGLNDVGTRMWQLLAQLGDTRAVREQLRQEYAAPAETLDQDLLALISNLVDAGLLNVADEAAAVN